MEKTTQLHILYYLKGIGAYAGKTKTMGVRRGKVFCFDPWLFVGFPDITGFYKDKIFFIEVKDKKNKQSPRQSTFQDYCTKAGITYILAYSVSDVEKLIN